MSVTPSLFFVGSIVWALVIVAINFRRQYGWANNLRITAGGLMVLVVLALGEWAVEFSEAKVLLAAIGGGIMVRGFERERAKPDPASV